MDLENLAQPACRFRWLFDGERPWVMRLSCDDAGGGGLNRPNAAHRRRARADDAHPKTKGRSSREGA